MRSSLRIEKGYWYPDNGGAPSLREKYRKSVVRSDIVATSQHAQLKKRPHIWVPPTPYEITIDELTQYHLYVDYKSSGSVGGTGVASTLYLSCEPVGEYDFAALRNRAVIKALNNLKGMKVNYAQAFAERRQTANLVMNTATKIARSIKALKRGDVRGAAQALGVTSRQKFRGVAESWLELQYGWKPLLGDIHGSLENLYDKDRQDQDRYRVTVRGAATANSSPRKTVYDSSNSVSGFGMRYARRSARVRLDYYLENPALAQASGLGLINPMELAWELMPWSFVADWFIPVGDYLSSMDADLGFKYRGGCATTLQEDSEEGLHQDLDKSKPAAYLFKAWTAYGASRFQKRIKRTVYATSPLPRLPGFKNPFSLTHMANAIALMRTSFKVK